MTRPIGKLPPDAEAILKRAASTGEKGSFERQKAINKACEKVRDLYPELFTDSKGYNQ